MSESELHTPSFSSSSSLPNLRRSLSFRKSDGSNVNGEEILRTLRREGSSVSEIFAEDIEFSDQDVEEMQQLLVEFHRAIHLQALELPSNGLTPAAGQPLASILNVQHETLVRLNLSKNPITSVGLSALLEPLIAFLPPSRLEFLDLTSTQLGPKSAAALSSLIRNNRSIQSLLLSKNSLGPKPIRAIATELSSNPTLQTLDLSYNAIKPKGAALLARALEPSVNMHSRLKVLDITCNKIAPQGMQALCQMLVNNRTIEELRCGANNLGEIGAAYLAPVLKFNYTLRVLDVHNNDIGPVGASVLVEKLLENRALQSLNLSWNRIGSVVTEELSQVLKCNHVLTDLNLKGNEITTKGILALAEALSFSLTINRLDVAHNKFDDYGAFALTNSVSTPKCPLQPQYLGWNDNFAISEAGMVSLKRIPQLRRNREHWLGKLTSDLRRGVIHGIDLSNRNIADEEILLLVSSMGECFQSASPPLIRSIWLSGSRLTPRSLVPLSEACISSPARVVRLYLKDCCDAGRESIDAIARCLPGSNFLEVLCVTGCGVSSYGAAQIAKGLDENCTLRRLNLDRNRIGDAGLKGLASVLPHKTLIALSVKENDVTDSAMSAMGLTQLQELRLDKNCITNKGALAFAQNLDGGSPRITEISLCGNQVTKSGAETIKLFLPDTIPGGTIIDY